VFTKDGIRTLLDIVIANPTRADLLPQSCAIQGLMIALNATQAKNRNYHNQHPTNQFLYLGIEVFGYLCKHADVFLHDYPMSFGT